MKLKRKYRENLVLGVLTELTKLVIGLVIFPFALLLMLLVWILFSLLAHLDILIVFVVMLLIFKAVMAH